jgi:two-component sensor histidine kinase
MAMTGPTEAFCDGFNHRLEALARVQALLSRSDETPITLERLIRIELDALGALAGGNGRITLHGPSVRLRSSIVQTLTLALHELATNARKYGALSDGDGRLRVTWQLHQAAEGPRLALDWIETRADERIDTTPARRGYGRELIEQALPYALGATTTYELSAEGARCMIDMPLERPRQKRTQ